MFLYSSCSETVRMVYHESTSCLVVVHISLKFPSQQPVLILQSIYHTRSDDTRFFRPYTSYPYSPRWSGAEMAQRMRYVGCSLNPLTLTVAVWVQL